MPKRTSAADATPVKVVIVTMDTHLASAADRASRVLARELPGLALRVHAASEWTNDPEALRRCVEDIDSGDLVVASMLFMEEHFLPVLPALKARRDSCDALLCLMSAGEVVKLTRLGRFAMDGSQGGALALLKRLRGNKERTTGSAGAQQMKMLRRIPKILRFIPGSAQDVRCYFLALQYWLGGSEDNIANLVRMLVGRYADGPRKGLREAVRAEPPIDYPEVGVYHPRLKERLADDARRLPSPGDKGTVGLLLLRSYLLAGNADHYDGVIDALEAKGLRVVPAFATGLDARPAIEQFFLANGKPVVDAVISLTGFSLVGGPAYNDARAAEEILAKLDVPYLAAHPVEFQTLEQWGASERGLIPVENTIMVAIPELDGATGPMVFGGRSDAAGAQCVGCSRRCVFPPAEGGRDMHRCIDRAEMLAGRVERLVALRRTPKADRKVAVVLFNFPPNAGNSGTAAFLSVFESLHHTLKSLAADGYSVAVPESVDALRERVIAGNAAETGAHANVHARVSADDHVRRETWLADIEAQWGPAPGRFQSDGRSLFVLGERFGNVFVGIQPGFGYEGDPMRLLFEKGFAPTHAFSAFYRWIREDFGANAVLHFGTHGALEFMPGKQSGMSGADWPDRLIGNLPNFYLYAANNPSEGTIAKRRSAATVITYLTPPVAHAGLYRGLADLKASIGRWRALPPEAESERADLAELIRAQAEAVNLPVPGAQADAAIAELNQRVLDLETTLIPHGLHVVGHVHTAEERADLLQSVSEASQALKLPRPAVEAIVRGEPASAVLAIASAEPNETNVAAIDDLALVNALDGRYVRPAPGGDILRTPDVLPTGRNLHGFDPFRIPSAFALHDGARQAERLLERHAAEGEPVPETVALVLWGSDNLKTEGGPIAQALALLGAKPRFDGYGRVAGATLIPLEELGRPRIDVVITLSGIFRDLLPLQTRLLAEATFLAASADEPLAQNFVRKHALKYQAEHGCDLETAALRVYSNADGAYGANVNHLVENGRWEDEDELAETYTRRKCFAYGRSGRPVAQPALLKSVLADVDLAYQNLDSVEVGVTSVDNYFDTLGGISRAVKRARGKSAAVYIGDQTAGEGKVRTLSEQVALETRTRMLNPKFYEALMKHGYEGVRQIESHLTNTVGWSATTSQVAPWVYQQITQTFVLDPEMRERLATLNPTASAKVAHRLLEAHERQYWNPDPETLAALRAAGEELDDRLEGIYDKAAA